MLMGIDLYHLYKLGMRMDYTDKSDLEKDTSVPVISQSFGLIWMEFGLLLRLVDQMNLTNFLSCSVDI